MGPLVRHPATIGSASIALPPIVDEVVQTYLPLVDAALPGVVEGLYLHGSIALGDFCADRSDVDFVAVCPARPAEDAVAGLAQVHAELARERPRPYFDGVYLTAADLAGPPDACP